MSSGHIVTQGPGSAIFNMWTQTSSRQTGKGMEDGTWEFF